MTVRIVRNRRKRGAALITSFLILAILAVAGVEYVDSATVNIRTSNRRLLEIQTINLCDAGVQEVLRSLWIPFKASQDYSTFDPSTTGASTANPAAAVQDTIPGVGAFAAGVISVSASDTYTRTIVVRSVGWIDSNNNGVLDSNEPFKVVDVTSTYSLQRSKVFDYTYFVNNYGWMDGFGQNDLIINGDMRANGDFNFSNGSPTVNGSVYATRNEKLVPLDQGLVNTPPVKLSTSDYSNAEKTGNSGPGHADNEDRWRPAYSSANDGAYGTTTYEANKDLVFDSGGRIDTTSNTLAGAILGDASGIKSWDRTSSSSSGSTTVLDTTPTTEVVMPDLSDLTYYQNLSTNYTDTKQTYLDGTSNPNYGQGAWVQTWNSATSSYQTVSTNGNVSGSAILIGTTSHPIKIHGPVTVSQDVVITGNVSGQGTLYAGRNVHIVGSIKYTTKPSFQGSDPSAMDDANEKADLLALAARGSVIMGNPTTFTSSYPLQYMTPPFTLGRYDDNGNWIPPYNAYSTDSTGRMLYQSVIPDSLMNMLASNVTQMDAVLYTNFVGGGNIGTGGGGVTFNGSIISKNEAMVVWSLPMRENYDTRIRERTLTSKPLIDVSLPRSPSVLLSTWQDRGFQWQGN
ncbi:MAG TPA: hypothetical protein VG944_14175 [Fimbriimonas sp.]|nr:hypothetical protein [Fimbriimonas sp.]